MRNGDSRIILGLTKPRNPVLGTEFAGEIEAVGKDVNLFMEGDQVFGNTGTGLGCYAEYRCVPEDRLLAIKPVNMTYEEAAAFVCEGPLPAWNFLKNKANIQSGQKILIMAASGSLGSAAIQLAKHFGAVVTGVCSTKYVELVKSFGADDVIDCTKEDFAKSDQTYDVIFDTAGESSFSQSKRLLKQRGVYLSFVLGLSILYQMLLTSKIGSKRAIFSATGLLPVPERLAFLNELIKLYEGGKIKPVIDRSYPLEKMAEAHKHVEKGHHMGSVVITV